MRGESYTTEEVAKQLKVSKLTIYDLIKKGELPAYRVGRQMRIDVADLEQYIQQLKTGSYTSKVAPEPTKAAATAAKQTNVISGQDLSLDILAKYLEKHIASSMLRAYNGSLTSLLNLYQSPQNIVSLHLFDGDTGEYNIPYVKRVLVGRPAIVLNLLSRKTGFYVQKGNPKQLQSWHDLRRKDIQFVNREHGAGIRVLVDEQLRINGIPPSEVKGYTWEESNHIGVASSVISGKADVGVGAEKIAQIVGVEFVPLITERYDVVMLKTPENAVIIEALKEVLRSPAFQAELQAIGNYNLSQTGAVMYETF